MMIHSELTILSKVTITLLTNGSKGNLSTVLLNQIVKPTVLESMGNKSSGGVSIVVGVITPNDTSISG